MDIQDKLGAFSAVGRICDQITVSVTDCATSGDYHATRTVTAKLGSCEVGDLLTVIAAVSDAARPSGEVS